MIRSKSLYFISEIPIYRRKSFSFKQIIKENLLNCEKNLSILVCEDHRLFWYKGWDSITKNFNLLFIFDPLVVFYIFVLSLFIILLFK